MEEEDADEAASWRLKHLSDSEAAAMTPDVVLSDSSLGSTTPQPDVNSKLLYQGVASIFDCSTETRRDCIVTCIEELKDGHRDLVFHSCSVSADESYLACRLPDFAPGTNARTAVKLLVSRLRIMDGELRFGPDLGLFPNVVRDILPPSSENSSRDEDDSVLASVRETGRVSIKCITWNMQAKPPPEASVLRERIFQLGEVHIFVVGSEECENTIAKSVLNPSKAHWESVLSETFGPSFEMLCGHTLQATHSIVFVHRALVPFVTSIKSHAVSTGIKLGTSRLGNKGGIGISFALGGSAFLFVNCHLAHAKKGLERRNEEYHTIASALARNLAPASTEESIDEATARLKRQFDCIVWSGDLNYRVDVDRAEADAHLAAKNLGALLEKDQLYLARKQGHVFQGFDEAPITFMPTYKYDHGSDSFDTSPKQRVPSWTDRVLFVPSAALELQSYSSCQDIRTSDHRPVFGTFRASVTLPAGEPGTHELVGQLTSQVCAVM